MMAATQLVQILEATMDPEDLEVGGAKRRPRRAEPNTPSGEHGEPPTRRHAHDGSLVLQEPHLVVNTDGTLRFPPKQSETTDGGSYYVSPETIKPLHKNGDFYSGALPPTECAGQASKLKEPRPRHRAPQRPRQSQYWE